jgi:hypothetical protein
MHAKNPLVAMKNGQGNPPQMYSIDTAPSSSTAVSIMSSVASASKCMNPAAINTPPAKTLATLSANALDASLRGRSEPSTPQQNMPPAIANFRESSTATPLSSASPNL